MADRAIQLLARSTKRGLAWAVAGVYLVVFMIALGDLTIDGTMRPLSYVAVGDWANLLLRQRTAFQFEALAIVEAPFVIWLVSPVNIAIGAVLGALTGIQIALDRIAAQCSAACGLSPAAGILAGLPGLLAGSACCAPLLFVLLGLQVTASVVTVMGLLIPAAFVLLAAGLVVTMRVAMHRCSRMPV
jgi:hypothetical protein